MSEEKKNDELELFLFIGVGMAIFFAINYFFGNQIAAFFIQVKKLELDLIRLFYTNAKLDELDYLFNNRPPKDWKQAQLMLAGSKIFNVLAIFIYMILGGFVYWVIKRGPMKDFNKKYNMNSLAKSQVEVWPWISPVLELNLIKQSIYEGKWSISKSVRDFVKSYNLLESDFTINTNRANKLFVAQLGRLWAGFDKLENYEKALLAVFIAHGCNNKDEALEGLKKLAVSGLNQNFGWVEPLFNKHIDDKRVKAILSNHAYVTTLLCSALKFARGTQVLPSCYFIWLKPKNRALWYSLNGVGRRVAFCEIAGIYSHWMAEDTAGHAIEKPYVKEAVQGLVEAIKGIKFD